MADYDTGTQEHLAQLRRIRDHLEVLAPMDWYPREVLNLTRWIEPEHHTLNLAELRRAHLIRAFACAALLRGYGEDANIDFAEGQNQTLVQLLASLNVLGKPFQDATLQFMAWRCRDLTGTYEDAPFYMLSLLVLILRIQPDLDASEVQVVVESLITLEQQIRDEGLSCSLNSERWLLGLTNFDIKHDVWQQIGREIGTLAITYRDDALQTALIDISNRLTAETKG